MSIKSIKDVLDDPSKRYDSEYYLKQYDVIFDKLKVHKLDKIFGLSSKVTQGPNPIFSDNIEDIPCLTGRNINKGRVNYENADYVSLNEYNNLRRFQIKKGDTLITLKGKGSIGKIGLVTEDKKAIFSRNIGLIRPSKIDEGYLNAYLLSSFGKSIIARGETGGTGQSTLTSSYLQNIDVPRLKIEREIGIVVFHSELTLSKSQQKYTEAEKLLLETLDLQNFVPSTDAVNVKTFKESFVTTGRLDAEYYQLKYEDYRNVVVSKKYTFIKDEYTQVKDVIDRELEEYNYIEIGDINVDDGMSLPHKVLLEDLPANGKLKARKGDLLISKVRPYRGAVSIIDNDYENLVVSGAFTVLRSNVSSSYNNEVLKVLLRSTIYKDWLLQFNVGTSYPVIKDEDVLNLPIPFVEEIIQQQIAILIQESFTLKAQSEHLLEIAKRAVEIAIEQDEQAAMRFINENSIF